MLKLQFYKRINLKNSNIESEKPKFVLKDYGKAIHIKLWFLLICVIFIQAYLYSNQHSIFRARAITVGIIFVIVIIFYILFQRKITIDFYDDKIEFFSILSTKKDAIILNQTSIDKIIIRPYNLYSSDNTANPVGTEEYVGPFKVTTGKNDIRLSIFLSCVLYALSLPFIVFLKLTRQIKSIKLNCLDFDGVGIPLSELSSYEFSQLNNYLKEKFGLEIKNIRKINFKGETIC